MNNDCLIKGANYIISILYNKSKQKTCKFTKTNNYNFWKKFF